MKKINYFGKEYAVSDDVKWVVTCPSGNVLTFTKEPRMFSKTWISDDIGKRIDIWGAATSNWKNSLREVKDIIVKENELKVGDKVELLGDCYGFKKGQIVELYELEDDGPHLFKGSNDAFSYCDGDGGAYLFSNNYKALTPLDDKKALKIKCVDNKGSGYFTIGKEYDCFITDELGNKESNCDFSHLATCYFGRTLDNVHGTFELVDERKPHPHADLMLKYAMIAQYDDNPWESFEFKNQYTHSWMGVVDHPCWDAENEYRLKPQEPKIQIGQVWTSKEGIDVTIGNLANKLVFTKIEIGGIVIPWSFKEDVFFGSFKCKE